MLLNELQCNNNIQVPTTKISVAGQTDMIFKV